MLPLQQPRRQFQTLNFRLFTQDMRVLKHYKSLQESPVPESLI